MDPATILTLVALGEKIVAVGSDIAAHHDGSAPLTPDDLASKERETADLVAQAHALLNAPPAAASAD